MKRNPLLGVVALAVLAAGGALVVALLVDDPRATPPAAQTVRIISLIPPITDTLCQIGAEDLLVGRSDYCDRPDSIKRLPSCGTTLHPNVEAIARLQPTLIVGENSVQAARGDLRALARAEFLPWLSRDDVLAGTRELGRLTGCEAQANALADELAAALPQQAPASGPRVLLAMAHEPGQMNTIWFLRRNSIHGAALHAAGARNVVEEDITGTPSLSIERVLQLDPDIVIVLHAADDLSAQDRAQLIADWRGLKTLRAARANRITVVNGKHIYPAGRDILRLIDALRGEVNRLKP